MESEDKDTTDIGETTVSSFPFQVLSVKTKDLKLHVYAFSVVGLI